MALEVADVVKKPLSDDPLTAMMLCNVAKMLLFLPERKNLKIYSYADDDRWRFVNSYFSFRLRFSN